MTDRAWPEVAAASAGAGVLLVTDRARRVRLLGDALGPAPADVAQGLDASGLFAAGSRDAVDAAIRRAIDDGTAASGEAVRLQAGSTPVLLRVEPLRNAQGEVVAACLLADAPTLYAPLGDAPLGDAPLGDAPVGDAPLGDAPLGDAPGSRTPQPGASEPPARKFDDVARAQRREALGQLSLGIAHDFGNLVTAILGAAEALGSAPAVRADPETAADVAAIRTASERASRLVRQLMAFGGGVDRHPAAVSPDAAIADLGAMLERLWHGRAKLVLDLGAPGRTVRIDPTEFDQIILNLAMNARDAMLDGGTLTIRTRPVAPDPGEAGRVAVEMADTGIGIAPDVVGRIFDPFFTTKRARGGSGLGLATVAALVRAAGGVIAVESTVGVGTQFRMLFPELAPGDVAGASPAADPVRDPPPRATPPVARGTGERGMVLLVDDDHLLRRLAGRALAQGGWLVLSAATAEEALDLLGRSPHPLRALVTDLAMPGMGGEALIEAVRHALRAPRLPVVVASGYRTRATRGAGAAAWANAATHMLDKPYLPSRLLEVLDAVVAEAAHAGTLTP